MISVFTEIRLYPSSQISEMVRLVKRRWKKRVDKRRQDWFLRGFCSFSSWVLLLQKRETGLTLKNPLSAQLCEKGNANDVRPKLSIYLEWLYT